MGTRRNIALASASAALVGVLPAAAGAETIAPAESAAEVLRSAAAQRGITASESELLALARHLGSASAAREFLALTPAQLAMASPELVTVSGAPGPGAAVSATSSCTNRSDRYSNQIAGVEFQYHVMRTSWCWDVNGNVTSVSGIRTSYGTTLAGQLQGYRWVAEPTVQEQGTYVAHSYTDKYGTHDSFKGRTRITGHWAVCLSGSFDWLCPVEKDGHTVVDVGYGSSASSSSYNS